MKCKAKLAAVLKSMQKTEQAAPHVSDRFNRLLLLLLLLCSSFPEVSPL
jgi:hypothetical protein